MKSEKKSKKWVQKVWCRFFRCCCGRKKYDSLDDLLSNCARGERFRYFPPPDTSRVNGSPQGCGLPPQGDGNGYRGVLPVNGIKNAD